MLLLCNNWFHKLASQLKPHSFSKQLFLLYYGVSFSLCGCVYGFWGCMTHSLICMPSLFLPSYRFLSKMCLIWAQSQQRKKKGPINTFFFAFLGFHKFFQHSDLAGRRNKLAVRLASVGCWIVGKSSKPHPRERLIKPADSLSFTGMLGLYHRVGSVIHYPIMVLWWVEIYHSVSDNTSCRCKTK